MIVHGENQLVQVDYERDYHVRKGIGAPETEVLVGKRVDPLRVDFVEFGRIEGEKTRAMDVQSELGLIGDVHVEIGVQGVQPREAVSFVNETLEESGFQIEADQMGEIDEQTRRDQLDLTEQTQVSERFEETCGQEMRVDGDFLHL